MKTFVVILILVTSALAVLLFTLDMPKKDESPVKIPLQRSLYSKINDNLYLVRRISKEGDISEARSFKTESLQLISEIEKKSLFSKAFIQDYTRLLSLIDDTAHSIRTHNNVLYTHLLKTKDRMENFEKKIKSIGLSELNKSWRLTQKLFHQFHRDPTQETFQSYLNQYKETKTIITELYLDDDQEEYLFSYLEEHHKAFNALHEVYKDVGFHRIHDLKPLIYGLKEEMQLRSHQLDSRS